MQAFNFDTVDSTNDAALRLIAEGRLRGSGYVLAREQTAGRGTQGRSWVSPRDAGIYLSIVRTDAGFATPDTRVLTLAAGVACAEALGEATGLTAIRLKPINDLIARGGKLGGILTECAVESGELQSVIVGIGINLRIADRSLPAGSMPPICLEDLMAPDSMDETLAPLIVERLVTNVDAYVGQVLRGEAGDARRTWERYLVAGSY